MPVLNLNGVDVVYGSAGFGLMGRLGNKWKLPPVPTYKNPLGQELPLTERMIADGGSATDDERARWQVWSAECTRINHAKMIDHTAMLLANGVRDGRSDMEMVTWYNEWRERQLAYFGIEMPPAVELMSYQIRAHYIEQEICRSARNVQLLMTAIFDETYLTEADVATTLAGFRD